MRKFKVTLTDGIRDLDLEFSLRNSHIADRWYRELVKNYDLYEADRFSDWGDTYTDLFEDLNNQIKIINSYQTVIDVEIKETYDQKDLNHLHTFFDKLRGEIFQKNSWYNSVPPDIKTALERFNILIHQLESTLRTKNKHPTLVVTFKDSLKLDLEEDDYRYFTYKWTYGTVYINYCQVGKTVLDVFKDHDCISEGIRPQRYYSADFMIKFGPSTNFVTFIFKKVLLKFWLMKQKFKFDRLALGMIPVADLVTDITNDELLCFNRVKQIECIS